MTNSEAIEVLKKNYPDPCFGLLREAVDVAINALSAQPDPIRLNIDHALTEEEIKNLKQKIADSPIVFMPSAQPVIRCKDCRYYKTYQYVNGRPKFLPKCGFNDIYVTEEDSCSRAERI